jgi:hypothetical protein
MPVLDSAPVVVEGHMVRGQIERYSFDADSEQVLYVDVSNSFPGTAIQGREMAMVINGADGIELYGDGAFWVGELPASQKYSISLVPLPLTWPKNAEQLDYTLSVAIYAPAEASETKRIQISANQSSAILEDKIDSSGKRWGRNRYLVSAVAGQKLNLNLSSGNKDAFMVSVRGADGKLLMADGAFLTGYSDAQPDDRTIELSTTQDYTISVLGANGSNYKMQIALHQ